MGNVLIRHLSDKPNSYVMAFSSESGASPLISICVFLPPLPRQLPRRRRRQHGLAKALEDRRHAIKPLAAGINGGEGGVELGGDAALFVERGKRYKSFKQNSLRNIAH